MKTIQNYTKKGLYGYEVFYIHYYGINIFLGVGEVDTKTGEVYIFELETEYHADLDAESLLWDYEEDTFLGKRTQDRYIVPDDADNTYCGKAMKITPIKMDGEWLLPITIRMDSRLYELASRINNRTLPVGVYYAKMICDGTKEQIKELMETGYETKVIPCRVNLPAQA